MSASTDDRVTKARDVVLIVDDTPANLAYLSDALDEAGYQVLVAINGATAIEQLALVRPDVILLDAVMPGMDGFQTCRAIREMPAVRDIPVIFMTALVDTENVVHAFEEGAVDYVTKPVRQQELLARIAAHLSRSRSLQKAQKSVDACGKAGVTLDALGNFTWRSSRAHEWLDHYCGSQADASTGRRLRAWLSSVAGGSVAPGTPGAHLCITREGGRLSIDYAGEVSGGDLLLLLEEHRADVSTKRLEVGCRLTEREAEVLNWLAGGKTNRDIAEILGMSPRTVNKHLERVYVKLGVENRAAAVAVAMQALRAPMGPVSDGQPYDVAHRPANPVPQQRARERGPRRGAQRFGM